MARGVRQSCPASGFLFAKAFDIIFYGSTSRSSHETLQPCPCAYADDFAVAASSFWSLMAALSSAFVVVDRVAGLSTSTIGSAVGYCMVAIVATSCWTRAISTDGRHHGRSSSKE